MTVGRIRLGTQPKGSTVRLAKQMGSGCFPTDKGFKLHLERVVRLGEVRPLWEDGDIPFQGAGTRGLSHGPTFQRCGDAAHLIEARIPLTADHLWKEAGRRAGQQPGRAGRATCGSFPGSRKRAHSCSLQGEQTLLISQGPEVEEQGRCKCLTGWAL